MVSHTILFAEFGFGVLGVAVFGAVVMTTVGSGVGSGVGVASARLPPHAATVATIIRVAIQLFIMFPSFLCFIAFPPF
jgi:hypothetical protein